MHRPQQLVNRRVRKLEGRFLAEYGFPSTHTMSVAGQAAMIVWYTWREDYAGAGEYPLGLACVIGALLVTMTSIGRLYLGVHTITDVLGGAEPGLSIIALRFLESDEG